jgi:hypothetical protein
MPHLPTPPLPRNSTPPPGLVSIFKGGRCANRISTENRKPENLWTKFVVSGPSANVAICGPNLVCDLGTKFFADLKHEAENI